MARAGWCGGCGNYVYLRPDGGCSNGHGPELISNPYEVVDAPAPVVAAQPVPGVVAQPAPVVAAQPAPAAPKRSRAGVIWAVVIALLLLCCCIGGVGGGIFFNVIPNPLNMLASPAHQRVAAAGDFYKALSSKNLVALRRTIPADAANAADPTFWVEKLMSDTSPAKGISESWNGDVLTLHVTSEDGTDQTVLLKPGEGDRVLANAGAEDDNTGDDLVMVMKRELDGWKVYSLGEGEDALITFDAAGIKKLQEENQ